MKANTRHYFKITTTISSNDVGWQLHLHHNARQRRSNADKPRPTAVGLIRSRYRYHSSELYS